MMDFAFSSLQTATRSGLRSEKDALKLVVPSAMKIRWGERSFCTQDLERTPSRTSTSDLPSTYCELKGAFDHAMKKAPYKYILLILLVPKAGYVKNNWKHSLTEEQLTYIQLHLHRL